MTARNVDCENMQQVDLSRLDGGIALDFPIVCRLGHVLEKSPLVHCIMLSKDRGLVPLLRQLNKIGLKDVL